MPARVRARHAPQGQATVWKCWGCGLPLGELHGSTLLIGAAVHDLTGLSCDRAGVLRVYCRRCGTETVFNGGHVRAVVR